MQSERRAASPRECATIYSIPHWRLRLAIKNGELVPRAIGRKSVLLFSKVEDWIEAHAPTKTSRPKKP
jgi:hypothetical protein